MIARLRTCHRAAFVTLTLLVPPVFVAALAARPKQQPPGDRLPLATPSAAARDLPAGPDTLLYWSATPPEVNGALPQGARLVRSGPDGSLSPPDGPGGYWVAYSLGHGAVTGSRAVAGGPP